MSRQKIYSIMRKVRRTCQSYRDSEEGNKPSILELAELFHIPISKERLDDYYVEAMETDENLALTIIDERTFTAYRSEFTKYARQFELTNDVDMSYISVSKQNSKGRVDYLYFIGSEQDSPLITKVTMRKGDYELVFTSGCSYSMGILSFNKQSTVKYTKNIVDEKGNRRKQILFLRNHFKYPEQAVHELECNTNIDYNIPLPGDKMDTYTYSGTGGVYYGIEEVESTEAKDSYSSHFYLTGFCADNVQLYKNCSMPLPSNFFSWDGRKKEIKEFDKIRSAIVLYGTYKNYSSFKLEILKKPSELSVTIKKKDGSAADDSFSLGALAPGKISIEEIDSIIEALTVRYPHVELVDMFIAEIAKFRLAVCINRGLNVANEDALAPKRLDSMTPIELEEILESKDDYFRLAEEQYAESKNIASIEKPKSFRMKQLD